MLGPGGLTSGGGTVIDAPLLLSTAAALACAGLVLAVEGLSLRPAAHRPATTTPASPSA